MIDYKELLIKYIQHVKECEGVDFIITFSPTLGELFTSEEWAELEVLACIAREKE